MTGVRDPLVEALAPCLKDVRATGAPEPQVSGTEWVSHTGVQQVRAFLSAPDGTGASVGITPDESFAALVVEVADQLQEWVVDRLWDLGKDTNWPTCPSHPHTHPLQPALLDQTPSWVCPLGDDGVRLTIGSLG